MRVVRDGFTSWIVGIVTMMCWVAPPALAQTRLGTELTGTTAALNDAQRGTIRQYVREYAAILAQPPSDDQLTTARAMLIDPLLLAASDVFRKEYSTEVVNATQPLVAPSQPIVIRLNAMIVLASMLDASVLPLATQGLSDPSPAVRYWAARALVGAGPKAATAEQQVLLQQLSMTLTNETEEAVVEPLLQSMIGLAVPQATLEVLRGLNGRVIRHATQKNSSLDAEDRAMRNMFRTLVQQTAGGASVSAELLKQLTLVSYRYLALTSMVLAEGSSTPAVIAGHNRMNEAAETALRWAAEKMAPKATLPSPVRPSVQGSDWPMVQVRVVEWRTLLTTAAFGFDARDLEIATSPEP